MPRYAWVRMERNDSIDLYRVMGEDGPLVDGEYGSAEEAEAARSEYDAHRNLKSGFDK